MAGRLPAFHLILPFAVFIAGLIAPANAQWGMTTYPVSTEARFEPAEARRGETIRLIVTATVDEEYHIYSMDPQGSGPIPTELNFEDDAPGILTAAGEWNEPPITIKYDLGFEKDIAKLYGSPLEFSRAFQVNVDTEPGRYEFDGHMFVQACTEESCLPPSEREWSAVLTVLEGEPVAEPITIAETATASTQDAPPVRTVVPAQPDSLGADAGFAAFMIAAVLFGLLALLTPCVFPMIPITISFFTSKEAKSTWQAARGAGIYVLSIIAGFTLLGFGASLVLLALGRGVESSGFANMLAADPWINLFFFALYFVFAVSLLGVVSFKMPEGLTNKINSMAFGRSDAFGIMLKAMVFVLVSFTCTAPIVGVLMVQSLTGEWTRPLFGMMGFATGMALPFFVLAMAPQLMGSLPRAGAWMYSIKVVMALLVLAAAFKFLSNADLVWRKEEMLLTREVLLSIWATIAAVTAFYLFGWIRLKGEAEDTPGIGTTRLLTGVVFGVLALYMASGLFGTRLHPWVYAYLPPDLSPEGTTIVASAGGNVLPESRTKTGGNYISAGYSWFTEVDEAMAQAQELNRPLFIDFTGYSCTNCRLMERTMFPRPEVASRLEEFVRLKLYTDDRERGAERRAYQAELFNTVSLPFYGILSPEGEILASEAYTTNVERYVAFLDQGMQGELLAME